MALVQLEAQSAELTHQLAAPGRARDTSDARDNLARSRADRARAGVSLFRSLSGGW